MIIPDQITQRHLPADCYSHRALQSIDGIVVHYVSARWVDPDNRFSMRAIRRLLIDLNSPADRRRWYEIDAAQRLYASYHYVIGRRGGIHELVPLPRVAYHAGRSEMHGREGCNEFCVGIACVATPDSGFTESQYTAFDRLAYWLIEEHRIRLDHIQGHEDVATPAGRKEDPGPKWDWERVQHNLEIPF